MTGIDEMEVQICTSQTMEQSQLLQPAAHATVNPAQMLANGGKLVSCTGTACAGFGDGSPYWPLLVHPECFPHGVGHKPVGMSMEQWVKLLLSCKAFADKVPFMLHMFDVIHRHDTNIQTYVTLCGHKQDMELCGTASEQDMAQVLEMLQGCGRGTTAQRFHATASPPGRSQGNVEMLPSIR